MNLLSINIRGVESNLKQDWIKELCLSKIIHVLTLQETMVKSMNDILVKKFWGNYGFSHVHQAAKGKSGGILIAWDPSFLRLNSSKEGDGFIAIKGEWLSIGVQIGLASIYAPQQKLRKKMLWATLQTLLKDDSNRT